VLDAGCGTGAMTEELARRGAEVVAIDISPQLVEIAEKRIPEALHEQITFTSGDMLSPDLGSFDHVMAMDSMIYYTDDDLGQALAGLSPRVDLDRLHRGTAHAVPDGVLHGRKAVPAVRPFAHDDPPFAEADRRENGTARRNRVCFRGRACQPRLLHLHLPGVPRMSVLKRISIRICPSRMPPAMSCRWASFCA
jgi:SAM-dependent methyltransferase